MVPSTTAGAVITLVGSWYNHNTRPCGPIDTTWLCVLTTAVNVPSLPVPALMPAAILLLHRVRPVLASRRSTVPSLEATTTLSAATAVVNVAGTGPIRVFQAVFACRMDATGVSGVGSGSFGPEAQDASKRAEHAARAPSRVRVMMPGPQRFAA